MLALIVCGVPDILNLWLEDGRKRAIEFVKAKNGTGFEIIESTVLDKLVSDLKDARHECAVLRGQIRAREWKRAKVATAKATMVNIEEAHL